MSISNKNKCVILSCDCSGCTETWVHADPTCNQLEAKSGAMAAGWGFISNVSNGLTLLYMCPDCHDIVRKHYQAVSAMFGGIRPNMLNYFLK